MNKDILRKVFLEKRLALSRREWGKRNEMLISVFVDTIDISGISVLHIFLPIENKREPDTWSLIDKIQEKYPALKISVPRTIWQTRSMDNYIFENREQIEENSMGIPEPVSGTIIDDKLIDMVVVPLIIFDKNGNRLGFGKGFYDAFFKKCRKDVKKVGLSLSTLLDRIPYMEDHDIMLDRCVTPYGVINFTS